MNKKLITLAIAGAVATPFAAQAGTLTVAHQDVTLGGGITGGYVYNIDTKNNNANPAGSSDNYVVGDALLDISSAAKAGGMGFDLGVGSLTQNNITGSAQPLAVLGSNTLQYGFVTIMPSESLSIVAGDLMTNVGYESAASYNDGNILRGVLWANQPLFYPGARVNLSAGGWNFYVENSKQGGAATSGAGASGAIGPVNLAVNLNAITNSTQTLDIVVSGKAGGVDLAANLDYLQKSKVQKVAGTDDNAMGIALYASVPLGSMVSLPMRLEYINDGTAGLYMMTNGTTPLGATGASNTAITFTITPTYNFSDSTFVRGELAYVSTDKKTAALKDDKGVNTDSNIIVGFQAGVRI